MDKLQRLDDRLEAGLQGHLSAWGKLPPDEIVVLSKEITAVRRSVPLGKKVQTARQIVIPANRKPQNR